MFTIVNKSTLISDADVKLMVGAIAHQVRYHAGPQWGVHALPVVFSVDASTAPVGSYAIAILDDPDSSGALGWHTEDPGDVVYGEVFARPVLQNGGNALTKPFSVASVLSHEVLETLVDPHCNLWADDLRGTSYALEVGDPVESDSYAVGYGGVQVMVSNFVTPHWFDPQAKAGERFDWMKHCTRPFQMTSGGYVVVMSNGVVTERYGRTFPEYRKDIKARPNAERLSQGRGHRRGQSSRS
jgi:hypothetical protein